MLTSTIDFVPVFHTCFYWSTVLLGTLSYLTLVLCIAKIYCLLSYRFRALLEVSNRFRPFFSHFCSQFEQVPFTSHASVGDWVKNRHESLYPCWHPSLAVPLSYSSHSKIISNRCRSLGAVVRHHIDSRRRRSSTVVPLQIRSVRTY